MGRATRRKRIRGIFENDVAAARKLRRDQTEAERALWETLRNRQLHGLKFRRQFPIGPYVADFCCAEVRLVIEVDGAVHDGQRDYDEERSRWLRAYGYRVIRFHNDDVLNNLSSVLDQIVTAATDLPPLPALGEGSGGEGSA